MRWLIVPTLVRAHVTSQPGRLSVSHFMCSMHFVPAALGHNRAGSGGNMPRWRTVGFELLKLGLTGGSVKRVVTFAFGRMSARACCHRVLRVQAVPTSPLMPNLKQFGRFGGQEQLCKDLGQQKCFAPTSLANERALK